jgi:hypothetical protein
MKLTLHYVHTPTGPREVIACEKHRALAEAELAKSGITRFNNFEVPAAAESVCDFAVRGPCGDEA